MDKIIKKTIKDPPVKATLFDLSLLNESCHKDLDLFTTTTIPKLWIKSSCR